ncbi:PDZ domain-containing protein [Neokomagataea tanensis]|uniref:PDZ domain-containing protein n=2 Tax=Neokomagataea tanensis TaxID=661191 RepID=A0A4Y6VAG3_9PROT|nr:S41 family peptidase [Neokomagataea thailandica]QDH25928.1 PDZ domain-containing protein [Neokomagataea tanensis]
MAFSTVLSVGLCCGVHPLVAQTSHSVPAVIAAADSFPTNDTRDVLIAALRFLIPRTLESHSAHDFSVWGLDGLTAIDPSITIQEDPAPQPHGASNTEKSAPEMALSVLRGQTILFQRVIPAENNIQAWAALVADALHAGWHASEAIQQNGADALLQSFFDELFNHLDPYSRYLAPSFANNDRQKRVGHDGSIGVTLENSGHNVVISAINANGPAWEAGLDIGQRILSVDGHSTRSQPAEHIQTLLEGDTGTDVALVTSGSGRNHNSVTLTRASVPPETVFLSHSGRYPVLKITSFSSETAEEMSQYLSQLLPPDDDITPHKGHSHSIPGLILDLRGDRGGVVQQAVTTAALFLDHGIAVTTHGRYPQANHIWAVQGGDMTQGAPIVILVDGQTASASEILASALADHRRAVVVGSETLGKGLTQVIGQMPNGGELFVTWSRNQAPLGWPLQGLGVMPQICTSLGGTSLDDQIKALEHGHSLMENALHTARATRAPVSVSKILSIRNQCPAALGSDNDMEIAAAVLGSPQLYSTALTAIPDENSAPLH